MVACSVAPGTVFKLCQAWIMLKAQLPCPTCYIQVSDKRIQMWKAIPSPRENVTSGCKHQARSMNTDLTKCLLNAEHLQVSNSIVQICHDYHSQRHSLLLASHSLRSISLGSTTSSLRSKSTTRTFVNSGSKYCFFSSAGGFFPFGFVLDFLEYRRQEGRLIK